MVKIEFTLNDRDTECLLDILESEEFRSRSLASKHANDNYYQYYNGHADYVLSLRQKFISGSTHILEE